MRAATASTSAYDVSYAGTPITGSDGNLTRRIDPAPTVGADRPVTLIAYDAKDNATQIVAPEGVPSGATVTCATDLSGHQHRPRRRPRLRRLGRRAARNYRRFSDPDLGLRTATTKYEYGDAANAGLITRLVPPRGNTGPSPDYSYATNFSYFTTGATAGMLKDVTDALGNRTSFAYDAVGRLTSIVDPLGNATGGVPAEHTTTLSYDREDRPRFRTLPAPMAGGAGLAEETRYDAAGNPTVRIDANGQVTTFAYDERNSLASVTESALIWTDPASPPSAVIVTNYEHDAGGNVRRITRAAGDAQYERVTDYAYDGRGLLRRETQYPGWPSTAGALVATAVFDPNGNPLTTTDPLGRMTTFAYDALNRLTGVDYSDPGTPDVAYAYDANGNRTSMTDGRGTTTYAVDEAGRLTSVTSPGPATVGYRYDLDGNRTKLIYSDGYRSDLHLEQGRAARVAGGLGLARGELYLRARRPGPDGHQPQWLRSDLLVRQRPPTGRHPPRRAEWCRLGSLRVHPRRSGQRRATWRTAVWRRSSRAPTASLVRTGPGPAPTPASTSRAPAMRTSWPRRPARRPATTTRLACPTSPSRTPSPGSRCAIAMPRAATTRARPPTSLSSCVRARP